MELLCLIPSRLARLFLTFFLTSKPEQISDLRMSSNLEQKFELLWKACNGPILEKEFNFCPLRKWRADYFHRPTHTLIEVEGGMWTGGRHQRGLGFSADAIKYNVASYMGFRLFRLPASLLKIEYVEDLVKICLRQTPSDCFLLRKK